MLNVSSPEWGSVWEAQVLPSPLSTTDDQFVSSRPFLGLMCGRIPPFCVFFSHNASIYSAKRPHQDPDFLVYSLLTHKITKKFSIPGILSFSANSNVIIIVSFIAPVSVTCRLIVPFLRARQIQVHFASFHLVHLQPYLLSHRAFQPLRILNQRQ